MKDQSKQECSNFKVISEIIAKQMITNKQNDINLNLNFVNPTIRSEDYKRLILNQHY